MSVKTKALGQKKGTPSGQLASVTIKSLGWEDGVTQAGICDVGRWGPVAAEMTHL